jgi:hypothetical protein
MTSARRAYATDLTDAEWQLLAPLIPAPKPGGRPPIHDRRHRQRPERDGGLAQPGHRRAVPGGTSQPRRCLCHHARDSHRPSPASGSASDETDITTERGSPARRVGPLAMSPVGW